MGKTSGRQKRQKSIRAEHGKLNCRRNIGLIIQYIGTILSVFKQESNNLICMYKTDSNGSIKGEWKKVKA